MDYYHATDHVSEFWAPARFQVATGIDYDIHNPHTDGYNQIMIRNWMGRAGFGSGCGW